MRVIVLGAPGTPPSDGEIERAWQLVQAMGQHEATKLILSGMDDAPPERDDVLDGWRRARRLCRGCSPRLPRRIDRDRRLAPPAARPTARRIG